MKNTELNWQYKHFNDLNTLELYKILQIRNAIFVLEQSCPYQDADDKDLVSYHLVGWVEDKVVAYCRILPPGLSYDNPGIGRVVVDIHYRKSGIGFTLMKNAIEKTINQFGSSAITIGAQLYLKNFYESLGFTRISDTYLEDGIPHIEMEFVG
jgi:ElaA protein